MAGKATLANTSGHTTTLDDPRLNHNPDALFYVTNNLNPGGPLGPEDPHPKGVYYSTVSQRWAIFNQDFGLMPVGADFNVHLPPPTGGGFVHETDADNTGLHLSVLEDAATDRRLSPLVFTTLNAWRGEELNPHPTGLFFEDASLLEWGLLNEDIALFPRGAAYNVYVPSLDLRTFTHHTSADSISGNWSAFGHPLTKGDPDAIVIVQHVANPGLSDFAIHAEVLGVWYSSALEDWAVFNQDTGAPMPEGLSFNVHVAVPDADTVAFVHTSTAGNTAGDATTIDHPDLNGAPHARVVVTQNFNPGGGLGSYNPREVALAYDGAAERWSIFNQNGDPMLVGRSFNVVPEPSGPAGLLCGAALLLAIRARRE
jgi:hypothetical protein